MQADSPMRASDGDRDHVARLLREHAAQGRLAVDEFGERVDAAYSATTREQLRQLLGDLPEWAEFARNTPSIDRAAAVSVDDLSVQSGRGGRMLLDGITLEMTTGVYGLLGPPGSGKSTLIRTFASLTSATAGRVRVLGHDVVRGEVPRQVLRRLGYLPQALRCHPGFTVREYVEYVAWLRQLPARRVTDAVDRAITRVGLTDRASSKLGNLPDGMVRRAGIAQAIVNDPDVVLLDEPVVSMDERSRFDTGELIRELGIGTTVILSTHPVAGCVAACRDVLVLRCGRVVFRGTPRELHEVGDAAVGRDGRDAGGIERGYSAALHTARQ